MLATLGALHDDERRSGDAPADLITNAEGMVVEDLAIASDLLMDQAEAFSEEINDQGDAAWGVAGCDQYIAELPSVQRLGR